MKKALLMIRTRTFLYNVLAPTMLALILFFGAWEVVEHWILNLGGDENMDILHLFRGICSIFFVLLLFGYHWARHTRFENEMQLVCSLLNPAKGGVLALDNSFHVVAMNARASQLLLSPLSVDLAPWLDELKKILNGQEPREIMNPTGTARLRIVSLQVRPGGLLLLLQDITEEKRLEDQWLIAEKMASFGRMAAGLAHEIGTPLNIISGRAEMLGQFHNGHLDSSMLEKNAKAIEQQVARISTIIQQLLAHSNSAVPSSGLFSVNQLVEKVLDYLSSTLQHEKIEVQLSLQENLPSLSGYADQLEQVIIHLFLNSIDAMHGKENGVLQISTSERDSNVELKVIDNGCGIPQENLTKIFDPFFTTKEFGSGTGLGLSAVSSIVKSHGGKINVNSRPVSGTTFTVSLPAAVETAQN